MLVTSCYWVSMYIAKVPNRNSPPAILLREGYREVPPYDCYSLEVGDDTN